MGVVLDMDMLLEKRGEPKIGGSVGGFIALVVSLILVIVVACTAIFFLLRHDSSEEGARRQRRYQHQPVPSSASYTYHSSSVPAKSWLASLQAMFTGVVRSGRYNPVRRTKVRDGWLQATGDEWDDNSPDDHERLRNMGDGQYMVYSPAVDPPFHPHRSMVATESTSTVHLDESRIPNRFVSPEESPIPSVHNLPPVESFPIPRSASPEFISAPQSPHSIHIEPQNTDRPKDSMDSDISTSSGSKFVERL